MHNLTVFLAEKGQREKTYTERFVLSMCIYHRCLCTFSILLDDLLFIIIYSSPPPPPSTTPTATTLLQHDLPLHCLLCHHLHLISCCLCLLCPVITSPALSSSSVVSCNTISCTTVSYHFKLGEDNHFQESVIFLSNFAAII